jgi:quercetin dioxygenase-like cupin family protein
VKALTQTLQEIAALTAKIESDYPELYAYLEENPLTIPQGQGAGIPDSKFESYLESLKQLLRNHIETHRKKKQKLEELTSQIRYDPENIQVKVIFEKGNQKTALFAFSEGQELAPQPIPTDVILIGLEGSCKVRLEEGEEQRIKAGQVFRIPGETPHALRAVSNFKMVLIK